MADIYIIQGFPHREALSVMFIKQEKGSDQYCNGKINENGILRFES